VLDLSRGVPWARWFPGGQFNYVHNAVDRHALSARRDLPALLWEGDDGASRRLSYAEVYAETNRLAHVLRGLGVGKGDRVGLFKAGQVIEI
jgi:acetyl-CoA synthetase